MGNFLVITTRESYITIVKCLLRLTIVMVNSSLTLLNIFWPGSGPDPIKMFLVQNYVTLVFKHSDWLLQNFNQ